MHRASAAGITIKLISGTRTDAEQDALYAKGRTTPGPKVTNARAGQSNHNFGIAFDVGIFVGSAYLPESPDYRKVGIIGKELGFSWGGDWRVLKDEPHLELIPEWGQGMAESDLLQKLRERKASGTDVFAAVV